MKKTLINSFVFGIGYIIITASIAIITTCFSVALAYPMPIPSVSVVFAVFIPLAVLLANYGVLCIKYSFTPGISSCWSLKKGEIIHLERVESRYPHDFITVKRCPFDDNTPTELIRSKYGFYTEHNVSLVVGFRYFFDGKKLQTVLPRK